MSNRTLSYPTDDGVADTPFPTAYLVVAFDCEQPLRPAIRLSVSEVSEVRVRRGDARRFERTTDNGVAVLDLFLDDLHLSSLHARLVRGKSGASLIDAGSKNGTFLNGSRVAETAINDGDIIEVGNTLLLFRDGVDRYPKEPADVEVDVKASGLPTLSPPLQRAVARAAKCATTTLPILLTGSSGTGKEVAARWIHATSKRKGKLVSINCGALPPTLIESELFGAKRGAFSGADKDRPGLIRAADKGTLFLDEIGELPPPAQVKLLRVLQEKEVTAVGDTNPVAVDIRIISATLRDVDAAVEAGEFRADLLARIAGFRFELPALCERREDIGSLVAVLLRKLAGGRASELRFDRAAGRALFNYDWPLNIRELEQALHAALALCDGSRLGLTHLPEAIQSAAEPVVRSTGGATPDDDSLRQELIALLTRHQGNVSAVARGMGRARVQIRRWCQRLELDIESYRS